MGFVKEFRKLSDAFPEWEYLNKIGVRNMFGKPIEHWTTSLVVDRENNYYLIPKGHTSPARDGEEINYYALCINDQVINMEAKEQCSGNGRNKTFECHWIIIKIEFPPRWTFDLISKEELKDIICEAFVVRTYNRSLTPEKVKSITVDISTSFENSSN